MGRRYRRIELGGTGERERMEGIGGEGMGGKFASSFFVVYNNKLQKLFKLCPKFHNSVLPMTGSSHHKLCQERIRTGD